MGIKYSFVDNEVYGTEDVNEIAACLTGAGIAPFLSKDSYNTSDLNSVTEALVSSGVDLDGCICTAQNVGTAEMSISVAQGIVFFDSGIRLIIDAEGYSVSAVPNTAGHVFAYFSPALQVADITFATELPSDGEYVELARVKADGSIENIRQLARSKVGTMGRNTYLETTFSVLPSPILHEGEEVDSTTACMYITAKLEGVDASRYSYLFIGAGFKATKMGLYSLNENKLYFSVASGSCDLSPAYLWAINNMRTYVQNINGEICITLYGSKEKVKAAMEKTNLDAIFF